jgi:hypothetical protein
MLGRYVACTVERQPRRGSVEKELLLTTVTEPERAGV